MKLHNEREQIEAVAERWRAQYWPRWNNLRTGRGEVSSLAIYEALRALNTMTATAADVAAIIGNEGWIARKCDECQRDNIPDVVELGDEPDYESRTVTLCVDCLRNAVDLVTGIGARR